MSTAVKHGAPARPGRIGYVGIAVAIVLVQFVGWRVTTPAIPDWYAGLTKPSWTPPNWVFGPVWAILYVLMGASAALVWARRADVPVNRPLALFGLQLASNLLWSVLFFGARAPGLGLADIGLLWVLIGATVIAFWRVSRTAGLLLLPYWGWVSYAAALNAAIVGLN